MTTAPVRAAASAGDLQALGSWQRRAQRHACRSPARLPRPGPFSFATARAGWARIAARSAAGHFESVATRRRRSGWRSRTISSSSASASAGCSVARTLGDAGIAAFTRTDAPGFETVGRPADFARVGGEDDRTRLGRGTAIRDLEQQVVAFRVVQVSTRRQPLQPDIARDAGHLDDAIRAPVAGPLEQRGMSAVRHQPMQAVAAQQGRGRRGRRLSSGAGDQGRDGRFVEHAETVPRVTRASAPRHRHCGTAASSERACANPSASRVAAAPRASAC